jgi:hypothetical protein
MTQYTKPPVKPAWAETAANPADIIVPANSDIQAGWPLSAVPPSRQRFNWILNWCSNAIRYFMQRGLVDYDATESYAIGARVIGDDGKTYKCIQAGVGQTPSTATAYWERWGYTASELAAQINPWVPSGIACTYVSPNSFTVVGDQTAKFQTGLRIQFGTVYGNVQAAVFSSTTLVTMQMDGATVLPNPITIASFSILQVLPSAEPSVKTQSFQMGSQYGSYSMIGAKGVTVASAPTTPIFSATDGDTVDISGNVGINSLGASGLTPGHTMQGTILGTPTITPSASLTLNGGGAPVVCAAGDTYYAWVTSATTVSMIIMRNYAANLDARYAGLNAKQLNHGSITASGTWTAPAGIVPSTLVELTICGAGSGGAGANSANACSPGGGHGAMAVFNVSGLTGGVGYAVTIGAGGAGGSAAGTDGLAGGATSITINGTTYTANGGVQAIATTGALSRCAAQGTLSASILAIADQYSIKQTNFMGFASSPTFCGCNGAGGPLGSNGIGGGTGAGPTAVSGFGVGGGGGVGATMAGSAGANGVILFKWIS